ncbi:LysR family transcriptional regulator [Staphylococcus capitis]|uniref:LysR family transcriptional regulator n=1 Tax=Staphylococcus capitis TaxID=29388 RepID=UPI0034CF2C51
MNTKQMMIFKQFVEFQNENAVAESMNITQPTVTFHLKNLNKYYGIPLYYKKGKHFKLTEAGELLYRNTTKLLNLMQETNDVMSDFKASKRGTLKIGASHAPVYHILPEAFKSYMNNHPNIQIDLTVDTAPHIIDKLRSREIELAVISENAFYENDLKVKRFMENELMIVMDKEHPLAHKEALTMKDLEYYDFVIHSGGSTRESIDEWRRDNLVQLRARMQSNSLSSILETIKHSHYLSLISHSAIQHRQDIVSKKLPNGPRPRYISIVYRDDMYLTPVIQNFILLIYNVNFGEAPNQRT